MPNLYDVLMNTCRLKILVSKPELVKVNCGSLELTTDIPKRKSCSLNNKPKSIFILKNRSFCTCDTVPVGLLKFLAFALIVQCRNIGGNRNGSDVEKWHFVAIQTTYFKYSFFCFLANAHSSNKLIVEFVIMCFYAKTAI